MPVCPYNTFIRFKPMTTSFADYCATADARAAIAANVEEWCQMLCLALEHNFIDEAIRRQKFFAANDSSDFTNDRIEAIKNGDHYKFVVESGRKYHKIVQTDNSGCQSVHAFVDKKTGELYKAASFKAPAKGVRYDLRLIKDREFVLKNCDWAGGYLYKN